MTYLKRHVFLTTVMLSAINVALPASAEKDDDNKVHFVVAFATKTQYKLPQKQSASYHKFKV